MVYEATGIVEGPASLASNESFDASIAIDGQGRFIIAYSMDEPPPTGIQWIFLQRFDTDGACICDTGDECPATVSDMSMGSEGNHRFASVAMNRGGPSQSPDVIVSWIADQVIGGASRARVRSVDFGFEDAPFDPPKAGPLIGAISGPGDREPSAGMANSGVGATSWVRPLEDTLDPADERQGVMRFIGGVLNQVRCCGRGFFLRRGPLLQYCLSAMHRHARGWIRGGLLGGARATFKPELHIQHRHGALCAGWITNIRAIRSGQ